MKSNWGTQFKVMLFATQQRGFASPYTMSLILLELHSTNIYCMKYYYRKYTGRYGPCPQKAPSLVREERGINSTYHFYYHFLVLGFLFLSRAPVLKLMHQLITVSLSNFRSSQLMDPCPSLNKSKCNKIS